MKSSQVCGNCNYFDAGERGPGLCRRDPPRSVLKTEGGEVTLWPKVNRRDWCGEYAPKEAE